MPHKCQPLRMEAVASPQKACLNFMRQVTIARIFQCFPVHICHDCIECFAQTIPSRYQYVYMIFSPTWTFKSVQFHTQPLAKSLWLIFHSSPAGIFGLALVLMDFYKSLVMFGIFLIELVEKTAT